MTKIRNYGVGTGYNDDGITGEKSTFEHDEKVYAYHSWDDLFAGAAFKIRWYRKVAGDWKLEEEHLWINPSYTSAYQWAWIKDYPAGEWRVEFRCSTYGPYYSYFTIKSEEVPIPSPDFPKTISREPYSFAANNAEEEKQLKEFLGIEPAGLPLDDWLAPKGIEDLDYWKNYWADIFVALGRNDLFAFIASKYIEYKEKIIIPPEPPEEPSAFVLAWQSLTSNIKDRNWLEAGTAFLSLFTASMFPGDVKVIAEPVIIGLPGTTTIVGATTKAGTISKLINAVKNGLKALALDFKKRPLLSILLGIFALTEIPNYFNMRIFARNQIAESAGRDPASITFPLNEQDSHFESLQFELGTALKNQDKVKALEILASMINARNTFAQLMEDKKQTLIEIGLYETELDNLAYFDDVIARAKIEIEALIPLGKTGTLIIRPTPSDAKVSVEGQIPTTGIFSEELSIGTYSVTVSKFGYLSATFEAEVKENIESDYPIIISEVGIEPTIKAKLIISILPSDAVIEVADHPEINSPGTYEIDPGSYTINFSRTGFQSQQRTVFIDEGKIETVSVILKEIPPMIPPEEIKGSLTITVIPAAAVVEIAGEPDIVEPGTYELLTGSYSVKASKDGFISQTKSAFVSEDKNTVVSFILEEVEAPVELPTKSTIIITSEPTNSDIYIDGKYTFTKTPFTTILEAGTYIIRVQTAGYYPQEATVTFGEGDEIIVPFILTELPEEVVPTVTYTPYEPWFPDYQPTTYYTPAVQPTPYSQVSVPNYSLIAAPTFTSVIEPVYSAPVEKEIMINIETTDLNPWEGKIFSIAWLDLTTPGAEAQVIVDEDEKGILEAFMQEFEAGNYKTILGYNLKFDYQWIFNKLMLYRIPAQKFYSTSMRDVYQLMSQIKEEFVYNARGYGTLDDYGKELLGIGKYGDQETLLRRFTSGDYDYVEAFQFRQIEITNGLYQLFRYCSSEGFISPILSSPSENIALEPNYLPESPIQTGQKQCANCLAFNPINATQCEVCGSTIFK